MNDSQFEEQKTRIVALEQRWIETLGLRAWDIDTEYVRGDFTSDGDPAPHVLATSKVDARYMHARVSWNMHKLTAETDRELEYAFLHEFMHIFVNEMRPSRLQTPEDHALESEDRWHEERVATMLGWAFLWTREAVLKEGA